MKRIIAVILVMMYLFSFSAFAESAELTEMQKEDLYNLGIMTGDENGDLRLDDNITRAEAVKMICVAGNIRIPSDIDKKVFDDVDESHWAYKYICAAKENAIINGNGNGNFNPNGNITNEEIVKMIVCLLGYKDLAEARGGYPAGYTAAATRIGITSNLNLKTKTPAVRSDVAIMISNSLDIPIMAQKGVETDAAVEYILLNGKNGTPFISIRGTRGKKWDTSLTNIDKLAQAFASQYPYKEGDAEKSIELYPDIMYLTGIEKTAEGIEYECPAIYDDRHVHELVTALELMPGKLAIKDLSYEISYAVFNSKVLVPYDMFKLMECDVLFNEDTYVSSISKDNTILEIIPNIVGMRKNQAEGYWVPLQICARFVDDVLYIPLEAVAKEFGYVAEINKEESIITIK